MDMDTGTAGVPVQAGSTYVSTTMSRAGERTLLSIPSNSTSSMYTADDSNSQQPSFSGETRDSRGGYPSTRAEDSTSEDAQPSPTTNSSRDGPSETGRTRGADTTRSQDLASGSDSGPYSTPPLVVLEKDSAVPGAGTVPSEVSVSSVPPLLSTDRDVSSTAGRGQGYDVPGTGGTSTESSTAIHTPSSTTQREGETEAASSLTEEAVTGVGLTTAPPSVPDSMTAVDDSLSRFLSGQTPFLPRTERPALATEVLLATTSGSVTHKPLVTEEEETHKETSTTNTTPTEPTTTTWPPPSSSSPTLANHQPPTQTQGTSTPQHQPPTQTQGTSTGFRTPTDVTTLHLETSTATPGITTGHSPPTAIATTAPYSKGASTRSPLETPHTTGRHTESGSTEVEVTTLPMSLSSTPSPVSPCTPSPCLNGGACVTSGGGGFTCQCLPAWTGPSCKEDVDECVDHPCPSGSSCVNTRGSFSCECPPGFDLEDGRTCTKVKTFLGTFSVNRAPSDPALPNIHELQREILLLLNASLSLLRGYRRSTVSKRGDFPADRGVRISAVNMFSVATDVSSMEVYNSIQTTMTNCSSSLSHCQVVLHHQLSYHVESLCVAQQTQCDQERSTCSDSSGSAFCQCLPGYYKHSPEDLSCIECGDGFKLENGTCVQCTFGFGGFNCGNFYKLIAVVVLPAGGAMLLILIIALIVTCCKKDKNDISKIIFKSGDLQMSPYADFPKSNRVSMEWGRETMEMQENGSTKNLLQMNDIYYSPALRNADLERNGLYPFTGLPGSRHSCIYPAQWNPSFISEDSRRRDYF
ncbi:protein HEG [Aplochiton taeniatus]